MNRCEVMMEKKEKILYLAKTHVNLLENIIDIGNSPTSGTVWGRWFTCLFGILIFL